MKIYDVLTIPASLYGIEYWTTKTRHTENTISVEMRHLRAVTDCNRPHHIKDVGIRSKVVPVLN